MERNMNQAATNNSRDKRNMNQAAISLSRPNMIVEDPPTASNSVIKQENWTSLPHVEHNESLQSQWKCSMDKPRIILQHSLSQLS